MLIFQLFTWQLLFIFKNEKKFLVKTYLLEGIIDQRRKKIILILSSRKLKPLKLIDKWENRKNLN
jgi:hypothetical protein